MIRRIGLCILLCSSIPSHSATYQASSLHNAVRRSEGVQNLFRERWDVIRQDAAHFDLYGQLNWIPGMDIEQYDTVTGETTTTPLQLVRTRGFLAFTFGLFGMEQLRFGASTAGFHYGLTRQSSLDRGSAGSATVSDYADTQYFDDIFALSLLYSPYVDLHFGTIKNSAVTPKDDGTLEYFGTNAHSSYKMFLASSVFNFLESSLTYNGSYMESFGADIHLNPLIGIFTGGAPGAPFPQGWIGYWRYRTYSDSDNEAVWISDDTDDDTGYLNIFRFRLLQPLGSAIDIDASTELQHASVRLIDKKSDATVDMPLMRSFELTVIYDFLHEVPSMEVPLKLGYSSFWDPGISLNRDFQGGNRAYGGLFSMGFNGLGFYTEFEASYNHAKELQRLVETVDKFSLTWSFSVTLGPKFMNSMAQIESMQEVTE